MCLAGFDNVHSTFSFFSVIKHFSFINYHNVKKAFDTNQYNKSYILILALLFTTEHIHTYMRGIIVVPAIIFKPEY